MGDATGHEYLMRMRFELERDDNPPLFDELMKFTKGTKRLNRLRTLAHEGLLAQRGWSVPMGIAEEKVTRRSTKGSAEGVTAFSPQRQRTLRPGDRRVSRIDAEKQALR